MSIRFLTFVEYLQFAPVFFGVFNQTVPCVFQLVDLPIWYASYRIAFLFSAAGSVPMFWCKQRLFLLTVVEICAILILYDSKEVRCVTDTSNFTSLETFIAKALKDQIINLDLLPGTKLSEMKIAKLYGCSRAPVRDAFSELRVEGYLETSPQVGTFVSQINLDRIEEIRFVRESVEIAVLRLGIESNLFAPKLPLLQANINEMSMAYEQMNLRRFTELDMMFHHILYHAVGKPFVSRYCGDNDVHYARLRFMVTREPRSTQLTIQEHREIYQKVADRSTDGINELINRHLSNIYNFLNRKDPETLNMFIGGTSL